MADENSKRGSGDDDGGEQQRRRDERVDFANLALQWAATIEAMRAMVDAWDVSLGNLRGTDSAFARNDRNRKIAAAIKTIEHTRVAEKLSKATREHLQLLISRLEKP